GRPAARIVCDDPIASRKVADLGRPASVVAGKFMDEYERSTASGLLEEQLNAVVGGNERHVSAPSFYGISRLGGISRTRTPSVRLPCPPASTFRRFRCRIRTDATARPASEKPSRSVFRST